MEVRKEMTIAKALRANPAAGKVFQSIGMHCLGCAMARGEIIEEAAKVHGVAADKLVEMINGAKERG
ncbi:MAG: DUF1858 domain-containing protein [Clostridiales bacterium]|jgi:hybrid cluster-associated redox disulfide protein|nr:DUF1858 domain-containing protein [Clostridiales bacterium]